MKEFTLTMRSEHSSCRTQTRVLVVRTAPSSKRGRDWARPNPSGGSIPRSRVYQRGELPIPLRLREMEAGNETETAGRRHGLP
jgi:hypothetical protein